MCVKNIIPATGYYSLIWPFVNSPPAACQLRELAMHMEIWLAKVKSKKVSTQSLHYFIFAPTTVGEEFVSTSDARTSIEVHYKVQVMAELLRNWTKQSLQPPS